ncbi:hypothetical protein [Sorangium sp. So ce406]|uniref:hypothetical protein n=1 Tax=Sorangium sp. So ce406 TaxID=3133311 RepID=UPI003F5BFECD
MAGMHALLEKLRKEAPGVKTVEEHLEEKKAEWLADLNELMDRIAGWLADGQAEGLLHVERRTVDLAEEDLGPYEAPALWLHVRTTRPRTVKVEPKGMRIVGVIAAADRRIVGARGRVDVTCGAARAILLRMGAGDWKLVAQGGEAVDLTEDAFSDALGELIE